jgi:hypothetical protein
MVRIAFFVAIALTIVDAQALVPLRPCDLVAQALDATNAQAAVEATPSTRTRA